MTKKSHFCFSHYLINFAQFNFLFLSLQLIYIYSRSSNFIEAIPLPKSVYLELGLTCLIQLLLYALLSFIQTLLLWGVSRFFLSDVTRLEEPRKKLDNWLVIIYSLSLSTLLSLNCYLFPLSVFSRLLPASPSFILIFLIPSVLILSLLSLNTVWQAYRSHSFLIIACLTIGLIGLLLNLSPSKTLSNRQPSQPHVIFIGVDSLSPDYVTETNTPNLYAFIQSSVQFKETISPLARTYPAWTSILTGLYPLHHFARYNLMPADQVSHSESIAWTLQNLGYHTLFATDDRRFNNLSRDFGFQTIVGPKLGINDILLGSFNDLPLSNLLINLRISHWLFPYNYTNRAGHFSYYPESFDLALQQTLKKINKQTPLFMAVHFALPHWPYAWAQSSRAQVGDEYSVEERSQLYLDAVHRADQQVGTLLNELQRTGFLENSLLIMLSDHGEAFYKSGSRYTAAALYQGPINNNRLANYFERKTSTVLEKSAGHGSDLLSPSQYHSLLAVKIFKQNKLITAPQQVHERVALIDIAPTVYNFLNLPLKKNFDGISLLDTLYHKKQPPAHRLFMLESGELPNMSISREKLTSLGKFLYQVNPHNSRLELRSDRIAFLDALKLYAILKDNWLIALYPDDYRYITVTLNLSDGRWVDDLDSRFAKASPASELVNQLLQFYSAELSSYPKSKLENNECSNLTY